MAVNMISSTIQLRRDLFTNFEAVNPVLKAGEPAVCLPDSANDPKNVEHAFELRIGDGTRAFLDLPAIGSVGGGGSTEVKVDSKSVIMNASGEIALNNFSDAAANYMPYKGEDGSLHWMPIPTAGGETDLSELITKVDTNTNNIAEFSQELLKVINLLHDDYYTKTQVDNLVSSAYTPGGTLDNISDLPSPPSEKDVGVIHPIVNGGTTTEDFVNPGETFEPGSQVVAVKDPETGEIKYTVLPAGVMDISKLEAQVAKNTTDIAANFGYIAENHKNIDNVRTNLLNNYYTKPEIDEKISSIYTPAPGVDNVTELPDPETLEPGTTIVIKDGGTTTDKFVDGEGETLEPGSQVVVVTDPTTGEKKYDVLPSPVTPDLSNYATKENLAEVEGMMVKGVSTGGEPLVRDGNGIIDVPVATAQRYGLVKSSEANENAIIVNADGTMTAKNITIGNLIQGVDDELIISGGTANG